MFEKSFNSFKNGDERSIVWEKKFDVYDGFGWTIGPPSNVYL